MDISIYNAIRESIISTYKELVEDRKNEVIRVYYSKIGKELRDFNAPRIDKRIEFINSKTGRKNHKTLKNQYQTYIFTQEMYDKKLQDIDDETDHSFTIRLKCSADDSLRLIKINDCFNPTYDEINCIYEAFGPFRQTHLKGLKIEKYHFYGENNPASYDCHYPIFDEEIQEEFENSMNTYIEAKSDWCAKYGCD